MLPEWLQKLRRSEIVDRVKNDPRSVAGTMLGLDPDRAREAAGWGQADFDEPWGNLSPADRVLLYAYFFQLGHLEELVAAFAQLFGASERPEAPIVVDLGCGPFTGGLAVASQFPPATQIDYIGVDLSSAMRHFGERLASVAAKDRELPQIRHHWAREVASIPWPAAPGWRPVIVIVSYLFASPTLDTTALVRDLDRLLAMKLGGGPVTVFCTNSTLSDRNRNFPIFRTMLRERGFELKVDDEGAIEISRWQGVRTRRFRYALFHRPEQSTLKLG